jgi:hypothetical protein
VVASKRPVTLFGGQSRAYTAAYSGELTNSNFKKVDSITDLSLGDSLEKLNASRALRNYLKSRGTVPKIENYGQNSCDEVVKQNITTPQVAKTSRNTRPFTSHPTKK